MTSREQAPQDHAYILRFWETRSVPPDPPTTWRFSLENLRTDEAHKFADLEGLTTFLEAHVGENGWSDREGKEGGAEFKIFLPGEPKTEEVEVR